MPPDPPKQVFDYIMQSLANYRAMHMRMQQLAAEGLLDAAPGGEGEDDEGAGAPAGGGEGALGDGAPDLDGFAAKLNAILQVGGQARLRRRAGPRVHARLSSPSACLPLR